MFLFANIMIRIKERCFMKNIMVCVTQQKTCDRLIYEGAELLKDEEGELFVIHVAQEGFNFLGHSKEGEALEYLFDKAKKYGANLTVIRSMDILQTFCDLVDKNNITHIILGEPGDVKKQDDNDIVDGLRKRVEDRAEVIEVPFAKTHPIDVEL